MKPLKTVQIGPATLYCGDSHQLLKTGLLAADALISDPPYGINLRIGGSNTGKTISPKHRPIVGDDSPFDPMPWIKHIGVKAPVLLWGADHYKTRLPDGGRFLAWDKSCGMGAAALFTDAEFAWTNRKNARCIYRQFWLGCTRSGEGAASKRKRQHPTEKPLELMMWCLDHARVGVGKTVLDPYMGSGTTALACLRTGRKFIGVELDEGYFDVAVERVQQEWDAIQSRLV